MNPIYFLVLGAYFLLLIAVSLAFRRKLTDLEGFFLADRSLPSVLVYLTLVASWLGATSTLVSVDEAFDRGVSALWVMGVPTVLTVLIFLFVLAKRIRRLDILTLPDLVERRYGRTVRHLSAILIVWYMTMLAASQMVAAGKFFRTNLGTSYLSGLAMAAGIVLLYSTTGGFRSVVLTDGLQFFLLISGIFGVFVFLTGRSSLGDVRLMSSRLGKVQYFQFWTDIPTNVLIALSFTMAWTISPIVWQRIQAAGSIRKARRGLAGAAATFGIYYGLVVVIGILMVPLFASDDSGGLRLGLLITGKVDPFLGGLLFIAVTAAVMSTMDTAINTGALSLTRDVILQVRSLQGRFPDVRISRLSTLLVGGAAFLVATKFQNILKTLGLASEVMTVGLFIPGMAMLFLRRRLPSAGFLALSLGGVFSLAGFLGELGLVSIFWPEWPHSIPYGLGLSLTGFVIGALFDLSGRDHSHGPKR